MTMATQGLLDQEFIQYAIKEEMRVSVFLMNGIKLDGVLTGEDIYTVQLEGGYGAQLVYKHAISTLMPQAKPRFHSSTSNVAEDSRMKRAVG